MTTIQTKIALRRDDLSNWNAASSQVLNAGEVAIVVDDEGNENLKIGNGLSTFGQLPYVYRNSFETKQLAATAISQGQLVKSSPTSFAAGIHLEADGNYDVVNGIQAHAKEGDDYAYVFNGVALDDFYSRYESHGKGTFNINPISGLSGLYIGDTTAAQIIDDNNAVTGLFRRVQLVKPYSADGDRMHLHLSVARDDSFTDVVVDGFDTSNDENYAYVKAFVPVGDSQSAWRQMPADGFYTDADDVPVMLCLLDVLSAAGEVPTVKSSYFLKYFWHYTSDGVQHKSDEFSIAVPSNTACGAIPADSVHKSQFYDLQQLIQPVAHAAQLCAYDDMLQFYECKSGQVTQVPDEISGDFNILLDDYSADSIYRIQFTVSSAADISPTFYVDYGNGPENDTSLQINSDKYMFQAGKKYYAEIQGDIIHVDTFGYGGASGRYPLVTASLADADGSLCCRVNDHTITTIEVSSATTPLIIKLPPKPVDGGARDFILRIEVSSSTAPGVTFTGLDESITFDSDADDWMTIEPGLNLISFTETK